MRWFLLLACLSLSFVSSVWAHIGDRIYPIFEISDETLSTIDLRDGSVEEWLDIAGEPTLSASDFFVNPGSRSGYDPADLDYRIWMGWNESTNRLYLAMERVDDIYVHEYPGILVPPSTDPADSMAGQDGFLEFAVDGDHNGGEYLYFRDCCGTEEEWKSLASQQAQEYWTISETPDDRHIAVMPNTFFGFSDWLTSPPYADGGGVTVGESPAISVTEFYVTPFDHLVWNNAERSRASKLLSGKVIGFKFAIFDTDTRPFNTDSIHFIPRPLAGERASVFADAVLVGVDGSSPGSSVVESTSWARIKASFGK